MVLLVGAVLVSPVQAAQTAPRSYAHLRFRGDLDSAYTADRFIESLDRLGSLGPGVILVELTGNRARPDLLFEVLRAIGAREQPIAVYLRDDADRTVGPGQLAIALAADHAYVGPATRVSRSPADGLTHLNPEIEDWSVVGLDLRHAVRPIASKRSVPESWLESLVAPRADMWTYEDDQGVPVLGDEAPADAPRVVERGEAGWSFHLDAERVSDLFGVAQSRSPRTVRRALALRSRPVERVEIESGLRGAHARCGVLVRQIRVALDLADAALDVRGNRRGGEIVLPRDYHAAADKAAALIAESRAAVAEIDVLTTRYPEILRMDPPPDARAPTEIGGPARSRLSAWRDAVNDAEYTLSWLDERVADYRRR